MAKAKPTGTPAVPSAAPSAVKRVTPYERLKAESEAQLANAHALIGEKATALAKANERANTYQSLTNGNVVNDIIVNINRLRRLYEGLGFMANFIPGPIKAGLAGIFAAVEAYDRELGRRQQDLARRMTDIDRSMANLPNIPGPVRIIAEGVRGAGKTTILNTIKAILPPNVPVDLIEETAVGTAHPEGIANRAAPARIATIHEQ